MVSGEAGLWMSLLSARKVGFCITTASPGLDLNSTTDIHFSGIGGHGGSFYVVGDKGTIYRHTQAASTP